MLMKLTTVCREEFGGKTPNRNFLAEKIIHALNILRTDPAKTAALTKPKMDVEKVAPEPSSGLTEPELANSGLVGTGAAESGLLETGLTPPGLANSLLVGTGAAESGLIETRLTPPGLVGTGILESGLVGAEVAENGFSRSGSAEPGLYETGFIGRESAEPDLNETELTVPVSPSWVEPNIFEQNSEIQIDESRNETGAESEIAIKSNSEIPNGSFETEIQFTTDEISDQATNELPNEENE